MSEIDSVLNELVTSNKVLDGIIADLEAMNDDTVLLTEAEVKAIVAEAIEGYPEPVQTAWGCYVPLVRTGQGDTAKDWNGGDIL